MKKKSARALHPGSHIPELPYLAESVADQFLGQIVVYAIAVYHFIVFSAFQCAYYASSEISYFDTDGIIVVD